MFNNSINTDCENTYSNMLLKQESSSSSSQPTLVYTNTNTNNLFMSSQPMSTPLYTIVNNNTINTSSFQQPTTTMPRYIIQHQQPFQVESTQQSPSYQQQINSIQQENQGLSIQTSSSSFASQQNTITELSPSSLNLLASLLNNNNNNSHNNASTSTTFLSPPQQQRFSNTIVPAPSTTVRQNFSDIREVWIPQQSNSISMNNNFCSSSVNNAIVNNSTIMSGMYNNNKPKESNSAFFNNALQIPPPNIGASENIVPQNQEQRLSPVSSTGSPSPTETTDKNYTIRFEQDGAKLFVCTDCSKGFSRRSDLKTHQRIHSNEKPYLCPFCEKSFTTSSNLRRHERIHTGSKPYQCETCGKAFSQTSHLKRHKSIHDKK